MSPRIALVLAFALAAGTAHAGGFGIPEIGVRRTGMAAIVGRPDDASAIYHNPAGLVLQDGWNVYLSMGVALLDTEFALRPWDQSDRFLGVTPNSDGYYDTIKPTRALGVIPMLAVTGEILPDRLVLGAAVYVANAQGAAFEEDAVTRYHLIDGYVIAPQAVLAAAYQIHDAISVGASAGLVHFRIKGKREVFPIINGMDLSGIAGSHPLLELEGKGSAPTWTLAAFGRPHPRVTWGATVTGRVDAELSGPVTITYADDAPDPGDVLTGTQKTEQMLPWTFTGGVSVDVTPNVEVSGELRYWLYRQYERQYTDLVGIPFAQELVTIKNYRDSWQLSGGARVHGLRAAPGLELMVGTHFDRTPAPPQSLTLDQPSFSHVGAHMGVRHRFGRFRAGASYSHYWYLVPTVTGSVTTPPTNLRGDGGNNIFTLSVEAQL